jgi:hypothetical protein
VANEFMQEFARTGRMQHGFLSTFLAVVTGDVGAAIRALAGGVKVQSMLGHRDSHGVQENTMLAS